MLTQKLSVIDLGNVSEAVANRLSSKSFRVAVNQTDDELELLIIGIVGDPYDEMDARSVVQLLSENRDKRVRVRIDSPGGLLFDGLMIHNALVKHEAEVITEIEGIAASAASIIAMAGDTVRMVANGSLFIHRAMGIAFGNESIMDDMATFLRKADDQIVKTYAAKTGQTEATIRTMLEGKVDGTVFDADEAKDLGFVDEIVPIRRDKSGAEDSTTPIADCVPDNPSGGEGVAVEGRWRRPTEADFEGAEDVAGHYAYVLDGWADDPDKRLFAHHYPANHRNAGKASLTGVRAALGELAEFAKALDDTWKEAIRAHLTAHLPVVDPTVAPRAQRDEALADDLVNAQVDLEQRVLEMAVKG